MKKTIFYSIPGLLLLLSALFFSCSDSSTEKKAANATSQPVAAKATAGIQWHSMEEALAAQKENPKKIFIDMYTSWCGWCKVMDRKTFSQPEVISYLNDNFYPVKFDAEQQQPITFKGKEFTFIKGGRRGIHELAYTLLDRRASYPSFVILDEQLNRIGILKGFQPAPQFLQNLKAQVN